MSAAPISTTDHQRSPADERMRRILRIPDDARRSTARSAENVFSVSLLISTVRCMLTYVVLPVSGPVLGLTGGVGPVVGLVVGTVSAVAIVASMRRFFRAEHRWRWHYTTVGVAILVFLVVQAVIDIARLAG